MIENTKKRWQQPITNQSQRNNGTEGHGRKGSEMSSLVWNEDNGGGFGINQVYVLFLVRLDIGLQIRLLIKRVVKNKWCVNLWH